MAADQSKSSQSSPHPSSSVTQEIDEEWGELLGGEAPAAPAPAPAPTPARGSTAESVDEPEEGRAREKRPSEAASSEANAKPEAEADKSGQETHSPGGTGAPTPQPPLQPPPTVKPSESGPAFVFTPPSAKQSGDEADEPPRAEAKQAEDKQAEDKQAEAKQAEDKQAEDKQPEDKQPEDKQAEDKQAEDKQAEAKGPEDDKQAEAKRPAPAASGSATRRSTPRVGSHMVASGEGSRWPIWAAGVAAIVAVVIFGIVSRDGDDDASERASVASDQTESPARKPVDSRPAAPVEAEPAEAVAPEAEPAEAAATAQQPSTEEAAAEATGEAGEAPADEADAADEASEEASAAADEASAAGTNADRDAPEPALPPLKEVGGGPGADLLQQSQAALRSGDARKAYDLAAQSYEKKRRNEAVKVMVLSACMLSEGVNARDAYRKLLGVKERSRSKVFCQNRDVEVLSEVEGHTAKELMAQAELAAEEGRHADAYRLAKEANRKDKSGKILQFMGVSACKWQRKDKAATVAGMLRPDMRKPVHEACREQGIDLP